MRALRDFNIPKIVTDDLPVFMGLIGDLFPALDVPRKRDLNFEKVDASGPLGRMGASVAGAAPGRWPRRGAGGSHTARLPCREKHPEATDLLPALAGTSLDAGWGQVSGGTGGWGAEGLQAQTRHSHASGPPFPTASPTHLSGPRVLAPVPSALPVCPSQIIKQSIVELRLQAEDSFVLKVVQLEELLQVRHSVFVIGNAGSGKSQASPTPVHTAALPEGPVDAGGSASVTCPHPGSRGRWGEGPGPRDATLLLGSRSSCSFPLDSSHLALYGQPPNSPSCPPVSAPSLLSPTAPCTFSLAPHPPVPT